MTPLVIYCDASAPHSMNPNENARSGWGAVFVRSGEVVGEASGSMNRMESVVAEFKAVRFSLEHAIERGFASRGATVIVASDCDAVEKYLGGVPSNKNRRMRLELTALAEGIVRTAATLQLELIATWVKGHSRNATVHGPHNSRADRLAKQACGVLPSDEEFARRRNEANARNREKMVEESRKAAEARAARKVERAARVKAEREAAEQRFRDGQDGLSRRFERAIARARQLMGEA